MLKTLRRIPFPEHLHTSGPLVKANLINHVKNHEELIEHANQSATNLLQQATTEAKRIRENVQAEVATSLRKDLQALRDSTQLKEKALYQRSSALCVEVCTAVFQQVIQDLPAREKIRSLVEMLLNTHHHGRNLEISCHPDDKDLVESEVAHLMAEQLNLRQWNVEASHELQPYEIVINTSNGGEIQVSLENLLALYKDEIDALRVELAPLINTPVSKESDENIN